MSKLTGVGPELAAYLDAHRTAEDPLLAELRRETRERFGGFAGMQISAAQGQLLRLLVGASGVRQAIEIGTFTGYSALAIALALPPDGSLVACDVSEEWTAVGRRYWERAGVADRIDLRLAPALETLRALPASARFDFAFVDADKEGYSAYYEELLGRVRPGGLIAIDNALWGGRVLEADATDGATRAIRELNARIASDPRVEAVLLAVADGLWLVRVR